MKPSYASDMRTGLKANRPNVHDLRGAADA